MLIKYFNKLKSLYNKILRKTSINIIIINSNSNLINFKIKTSKINNNINNLTMKIK